MMVVAVRAPALAAGEGWGRSALIAFAFWAITRVFLAGAAALSFATARQPVHWGLMWLQWDAGYYLSIVERGYTPPIASTGFESGQSNLPFFPLTPIGINFIRQFGLPSVTSGLLFAALCSLAAGLLLHRLALARFGRDTADWSVLSLYALPGSFVLSAPISEPPFLLLSIGSAFLARRRLFGPASVGAGLLTITRLTGILFGAGLALDWLADRLRGRPRSATDLVLFSLVPVPLLGFMFFMLRLTGDALAPVHSEAFWNQHFGIPLQNLFLFAWSSDPRLQMHSAASLVMVVVFLSCARQFTAGELLFVLVSVVVFSSTYAASNSLLRYVIGLYPIHLAFGCVAARSPFGRALLTGFAMLDGALMVAWVHGSDVFF